MTIKSRPTYPGLRPILAARRHVVAAEPQALPTVLGLLDQASAEGFGDFSRRTDIVMAATEASEATWALRDRGVTVHAVAVPAQAPPPDLQTRALGTLDELLACATMGTHLYAAGTEGFIGRVVALAADHGIEPRSVSCEHAGSLSRRVQCVHCKTILESVTTSYSTCAGCGLTLLARDHYSRRLAAFQGVCANAEDPSEHPLPVEIFT